MQPSTLRILATGGTIACTTTRSGALEPTLSIQELLASARISGPGISGTDLVRLDSSAMTLADVDLVTTAVRAEVDAGAGAIVVTHGTDSLEETAFALDLVHHAAVPVVLTGSQYPADSPQYDGAENLRAAVTQVPTLAPGVYVVFGGQVLPARGVFKVHTSEVKAFDRCPSPRSAPVQHSGLAGIDVRIIAAWPGAPASVLNVDGADGVVVVGMGSGNVGTELGAAMAEAAQQIPVVMATRVPYGQVALDYGGQGGGATLARAGVLSAGSLSPGQARIALATALAAGVNPADLL